MKILIAPDSFKESLSAHAAADIISRAIKDVDKTIETIEMPIADGGEGTLEVISFYLDKAIKQQVKVVQANGKKAMATYLINEDTAYIEIAQASGLEQIPLKARSSLHATSYGCGELMFHAWEKGIRKFVFFLGGSAINDGGAGMLQALGVTLTQEQPPLYYANKDLGAIKAIDYTTSPIDFTELEITIASDVVNPLLGEEGATYIFAPQKGMDDWNELAIMEANMAHYATMIERAIARDNSKTPGAGAAGGLGFCLLSLTQQATLVSGVEYILGLCHFDAKIDGCDYLITGEGRIDTQTLSGKGPLGIAKLAKSAGVQTLIVCGAVEMGSKDLAEYGVVATFSILHQISDLTQAQKDAADNLYHTIYNLFSFKCS